MIDDTKQRRSLDLSPIDLSQSYVSSSLNEGSVNLNEIIGGGEFTGITSALDLPVFHPGSAGARTTPGDAGFAYADTPQATVFIQKKQWVEQEWTYITGNDDERLGKVEETKMRIALGELIARKLDLLNDHELLTKFSEINANLSKIQQDISNNLNPANVISEKADPLMADILTLAGTPVTKYYTETLTLTSPGEPKKKVQNTEIVVKLAEEFDVLPPVVTRLLIRDAPFGKVLSGLKPGTKGIKTATPPVSEPPMFYKGVICNIVPVIPDEIPSEEKSKFQIATWWAIDLNKLKEEHMEYVGIQGGYDNLEDVRKNGASIDGKSVGFVAVFEKGIATGVALSKATITQERPFNFKKDIFEPTTKVDGTIINTFNGVMELANATSITTGNTNQPSPGNASITLENPDNLLYITEDDIEIALGTRNVGDDVGIKEDGTEYKSGDKLSTVDPLTGRSTDLYFHNGKFYTQRAFNIINRSDTSALGNFSSSTELEKINTEVSQVNSDLQALQDYKNLGLVNTAFLEANQREYPTRTTPQIDALSALGVSITQFPVVPGITDSINATTSLTTESKTDPFFKSNGTKVQKHIEALQKRKTLLNAAAFELTKPGKLPPEKDGEVDKTLAYRRSQLRKYFLNRSIFEVYDRVYIWISSPSRTTSRLADGTLVSEAPNTDANQQIMLQRIREIISLIRQLDQVIIAIGAQQNQSLSRQFSDEDLITINEELFDKQESLRWDDQKSKIEEAFTPTSFFFGTIGSIDPAISTLTQTIDNKILDLKTFSEGVKKSSKNLPNASTTSIANQSVDPQKFFQQQANLTGIDEQQIQVFQGVITKISRSYNDGKYTITLQCEDNLNFLQRSRYIDVAAFDLPTTKARRFLDDPIWRPTRDERLTTEASKNIEVNDLKGRWKTGIFTVSSKLFTGKDQAATGNQSSTQGIEDPNILDDARLRKITAPFSLFNQPFRGADPASILSILITGQPIDPNLWMANTKHTGTMSVPTIANGVLKGDEKISVGPFAAIRAQQEETIQKFGNFDPYIDLSHANVTKEERDTANLQSALNLAATIVSFVTAYVADPQRIDLFSSVVQKIKTEESQENGGSFYKKVTASNVSQILVFNEAIMPKSVSDIKIQDGALGDPRLDFLVRAAIKDVPISQLDETFKNLATPDKDQVTFNKLVESTPPQTVSLFHNGGGSKYVLSTTNAPFYRDIAETARSRATRGAVYGLLFNEQGNDSTTSSAPAANVNFPESSLTPASKKQIAALRGVKLDQDGNKVVSGNPIQATKASIIYNHKPNFFILANDYFRSPNLVDYVETVRPSPNAYQLDDWKSVLNRASEAAKIIDWELYADSQGHIRFKPPTYNRTLLRHVLDTTKTDIFLKTPFQNLFKDNNLTNATQALALRKIQTLTVQSKQKAIGLIDKYINTATSLPVEQDSFSVSALFGLKEPTNVLGHMIENDFLTEEELKSLRFLIKASLNTDVSLVNVMLPTSEVTNFPGNDMKIIKDSIKEQTSLDLVLSGEVKAIIDNITVNYFSAEAFTEADTSIVAYQTFLDAEGTGSVVSQIVDFFTGVDADSVAKALQQALRTAAEIVVYCTELNNLLLSALAGLEGEISTAFQNLTDERYIHVIPNSIIYSEDYQESPPEYTRLDVFSTVPFIGVFPNQLQQDSIQWAGSVDYDLWRIYGEVKSEKITAPFLRRADQAVLYAHQLMARQYSKILTGQITVRGDSKYQVGDTVFIEDEGLYYYVTEVRHSFQYGSNYTTTLALNYGRPLGTYIPYPFDILGDRLKTGINGIYQTDGTDLTQLLDDFDKAKAKETT